MITYNNVMAVDNPFVYGEIVGSGAFADREGERDRLSRDLASGQKVFLISPRRYGKSSLIRDVLTGLAAQRILTIEVTVAASAMEWTAADVREAAATFARYLPAL